jgi:hypothetical protein
MSYNIIPRKKHPYKIKRPGYLPYSDFMFLEGLALESRAKREATNPNIIISNDPETEGEKNVWHDKKQDYQYAGI